MTIGTCDLTRFFTGPTAHSRNHEQFDDCANWVSNDAHVLATANSYNVCAIRESEDSEAWSLFTIAVEYRGQGAWSVTHQGNALSRSGEWDFQRPPDGPEREEWLRQHRFTLPDALERAQKAALSVTLNGYTAEQYRQIVLGLEAKNHADPSA